MGVLVREREGIWFVFASHANRRKARSCGPGRAGRALADRLAVEWRAKIALGQAREIFDKHVRAVQPVSFAALAEDALAHYESLRRLRDSTRLNQRSFLRHHLLPAFGSKPVSADTFSELAIERWLTDRRAHLADSTLGVGLTALKVILSHAVKLGLLTVNPLTGEGINWKAQPSSTMEPFTPTELRTIIQSAYQTSAAFGSFVQVLAQTGMRPGEGLALRQQDLDRVNGLVRVTGTWLRGQRGPTKTASSIRTVSVLHPVTEDVTEWRPRAAGEPTRRVLERLAASGSPDGRLWPWSSPAMSNLWMRTIRATNVPYRKPHGLRHSWASIMLSRGANLLYIVRVGGWTNANVLLKTYARYIPADEPVGEILPQPAGGLSAKRLIVQTRVGVVDLELVSPDPAPTADPQQLDLYADTTTDSTP